MSIYATIGHLRISVDPWEDDPAKYHLVWFRAVPGHIGHPDAGYETDSYADFLPPRLEGDYDGRTRAVVIIHDDTEKVGQRYVDPLLVLTGEEWQTIPFPDLWTRICDALEQWEQRQGSRRWSD